MAERVSGYGSLSAGDLSGTELLYVIDLGLSPADRKMTLTVLQTWLATQNWSFSGSIALTGALTLTGLTVTTNGITVTGNSTITGTLGGLTTVSATTFSGALSGNASTATALQTARTLWGQSFDGTANVTGALTGVTTLATSGAINGQTISSAASFTGTLAVSGAITATGGSVQVSGGANPFLSLHDGTGYAYVEVVSGVLRLTPRSGQSILLNAATSVGSNLSVSGTLLVAGTVRFSAYGAGTATFDASGNITSVSDERQKTDIVPFTAGLAELRGIRPITHKFSVESGLDTEHSYIGFSAQNVREHLPGVVFEHAETGTLSLWDRGLLAATVNAVQSLDQRVTALEAAQQ